MFHADKQQKRDPKKNKSFLHQLRTNFAHKQWGTIVTDQHSRQIKEKERKIMELVPCWRIVEERVKSNSFFENKRFRLS